MLCSQDIDGQITKEKQILIQLKNEFILTYVDSFHDGKDLYCIITEYCQVGSFNRELFCFLRFLTFLYI